MKLTRALRIIFAGITLAGITLGIDRITVKPSQEYLKITPYSDSEDYGDSCSQTIQFERSKTRMAFRYTIGATHEFPYIGIGIERDSLMWNVARFDHIKIRLEPDFTDNFTVLLATFVEGFTKRNEGLTYRLFERNVDAITSSTLSIPLKQLETPTWWFAENKISGNSNRESLKKMSQIRLQSHPLSPHETPLRMQIRSIRFEHSSAKTMFVLLVGIIGFYLTFFMKKPRSLSFVPLDISGRAKEDLGILEEYLGREYAHLDMSLQKVVHETGLSETTIRELLKKFHHKGFKEYLNGIRMIEGARLLRETDRQIAEIALFTGFRHATTFTKLFRDQFGSSPREYREKR